MCQLPDREICRMVIPVHAEVYFKIDLLITLYYNQINNEISVKFHYITSYKYFSVKYFTKNMDTHKFNK